MPKAHAPYEFGVKVSIATTLHRSRGGQFALHAMALPGNPYDGHTLATIIPDMERTIGGDITRILADAGYRGAEKRDSLTHRVKEWFIAKGPHAVKKLRQHPRLNKQALHDEYVKAGIRAKVEHPFRVI